MQPVISTNHPTPQLFIPIMISAPQPAPDSPGLVAAREFLLGVSIVIVLLKSPPARGEYKNGDPGSSTANSAGFDWRGVGA
jgi:hypothetical protein